MKDFNIAPFALPSTPANEIWFEEPRDVQRVVVIFKGRAPRRVRLDYLRKHWPENRFERLRDLDLRRPSRFGWQPLDDWFNTEWQMAAIKLQRRDRRSLVITFQGLRKELGKMAADYDVEFRRTLGIRVRTEPAVVIEHIQVSTTSTPTRTRLRVELDAGKRTAGATLQLSGYNAVVERLQPGAGMSMVDGALKLGGARCRVFHVTVRHMQPAHRYCHDEGLVTFKLEKETFTISLAALDAQGPIWFAEQGIYIARADDPTSFREYRARIRGAKTVAQQVLERPEQTFAGAFHGQPRPHAVAYSLGCKHARQKFWLEPNGDLVLHKHNLTRVPGKDTPRFLNDGHGRFFFGLERWHITARFNDPPPVLAYNIRAERGDVSVEQKSFAVPLLTSILAGERPPDAPVVALLRFRFRNEGDRPATAELTVSYSPDSDRSHNRLLGVAQDDYLLPPSNKEKLTANNGCITGAWHDREVLRCVYVSPMRVEKTVHGLALRQELRPGETCEALLKIPYIALETADELAALHGLDFDRCYSELCQFWRTEERKGARLVTPEPHLDALHAAHIAHVMITDSAMPDGSGLVNTSVGTSTYGNYTNESCMINQELDQRGRHDEARRRLELWVKYQGTAKLLGNFTDCNGVFYGAAGFESGAYYCQHHGWVLWRLAEHYFMTRDKHWFASVADSVVKGADWVFRQRRQTMTRLPHSRGWEHGFLPAGGLEDVGDYFYWLSTNTLTWRGVDFAARTLAAIDHPEAARIRREADAYRRDLIRGFETARQHAPLVRLRDGRWVPHYPSRLYCRGRDYGWIREVLEGSIYLLISGLYDANSKQARWILDDYLDNRYMNPPFGYPLSDPELQWFDRGGFSVQPNLLAGLMPYLERDEPELYIWMFFNAWAACYREEINAMVEHPLPELGFANSAHFKTSDQANAVMWLRYLLVWTNDDTLHLGRAVPRTWFPDGQEISAERVCTIFGEVSVKFRSEIVARRIRAEINLALHESPRRILVRFRHPEKLPIKSVTVNAKPHSTFDAASGDVDITGFSGRVTVEARY